MNYDIVEVVIDKLIRRFRLREWQFDIEELAEDVAEALKLIGAASVFWEKVATLTVNNKVARIPKDCEFIKNLIPENTYYREIGQFIELDKADGTTIDAVYQSMPIDERGFPLVPDSPEVREAVMWYLARNLVLQGEIKVIPYNVAEGEWNWRCSSARASLNVLPIVTWNKVANDYTRLNPLKDVWENKFRDIGKGNTLDRDKYRYYTGTY